MVSITRNMLEGFVREGSFKWLLGNRSLFDDEFEEMAKSPNSRKNFITELSPVANVVVRRCSRILEIPSHELRSNFDEEASDSLKHPLKYARNFLEYCCFRALALSTQVIGHLSDKAFRRLTYDMMLAWELPSASSQPLVKLDDECSVGGEAFSRIAPAIPTIADVIICDNLFDVLTASTGGRLRFSMYEKYLVSLERAIRKYKSQSESSLLSDIRSKTGEKILEVDGTVTTQPVLQHVGVSTWPGRLILTDHALYFEDLRVVVSYDKAKIYDLSGELKQVVKPVLTGPWGTKLFDKAVMYNSLLLSEPVVMEFPELKGHSRRDYWLAIIREILYAHKFIRKFQIKGVERDDALLKAVLGILRLQALQEMPVLKPLRYEALLLFNLCDQLPGGDLILETLARMLASQVYDRANNSSDRSTMYSVSALAMMSNLGLAFGRSSTVPSEAGLFVGDIVVGELSALESAVRESRNSFKKVELAQASIDGAKMEGLDINLAVMEELLFPIIKLGKSILFLESWDDPVKSMVFCSVTSYIIYKGWMGLSFALLILFIAIFMLLNRWFNKGRPIYELKVMAPPAMNTMEQLLKLQNAISQLEELVQDGNVVLLKLRALSLSIFPKASEKLALGLVAIALVLAFLPWKQRRLQFVECPNDISGIIDAAKFADIALLLIDGSYEFEMAEGTSGESIDALAKVDIVKQRMEAAYETLQDVAGLTQLSASVEDVFASGDLPQAAKTLANMRHCLFAAVGEVAAFANVRKQLEVLEDRLEEMLQPHLSEALSLSAHTHSDWKKPRRNCSTFHHNILEGLSLPIWILASKRIQAIGTGRSKTCGTHHRSSDLKICFSFGCCSK